MDRGTLFDLYLKERKYQQKVFGDYQFDKNLNVASFLQFIEVTLDKAKKSYVEKWDSGELPPWLNYNKESCSGKTSPVETYEYLIKIFALSGAAIEAFTDIDPAKWREDLEVKQKWNRRDINGNTGSES